MHWRPRIEVLVGRCSVDNHGSAAMTRMSESLRQTTENLVQISAYLIDRSILLFRGVVACDAAIQRSYLTRSLKKLEQNNEFAYHLFAAMSYPRPSLVPT